jgi:hypothetical protein
LDLLDAQNGGTFCQRMKPSQCEVSCAFSIHYQFPVGANRSRIAKRKSGCDKQIAAGQDCRMSEFPGIQPNTIQHGNHTIRFLGYEQVADSDLIAAWVVIEPPTIEASPDRVVSYGKHEYAARADAFDTAKKQIAEAG